ncbi:metallophosphoesterase [candidate division KSB1 bacterium]|nr:metallophosphoesterase [candidate division KSB1 bacterium]
MILDITSKVGTLTWLHLSDIHFHEKSKDELNLVFNRFLYDIENFREEHNLTPDLIFITGDIAYSGKSSQYSMAQDFLLKLSNAVNLELNRFFLVPGNHDVDRDKTSALSLSLLQEHLLKNGKEQNEELIRCFLVEEEHRIDRELLLCKHDGYLDFLEKNYPHFLPLNTPHYFVEKVELTNNNKEKILWIVGLNTAWLGRPEEDRNLLLLGRPQVLRAFARIEEQGDPKNDLIVLLTHHPLKWLAEWDEEFCRQQIETRCDFHLRGHLHDSIMNFTGVVGPQRCSEIAAGALYGSEQWYNGYNFVQLDFNSLKGRIFVRRYEPTVQAWQPDVRYKKPEFGQFGWELGQRFSFSQKSYEVVKRIPKTSLTTIIKEFKSAPTVSSLVYEVNSWEKMNDLIKQAKEATPESKDQLVLSLLKLASDDSEELLNRQIAISCLSRISGADLHEEFVTLLYDSEPKIRAAAVTPIGTYKIMDGFQRLIDMLEDPMENHLVKESVASSLGDFGNVEVCSKLLDAIASHKSSAFFFGYSALKSLADLDINADYYERVIELLNHDHFNIRSAAANYFKKHVLLDAIDPLINLLKDEEESTSQHAAEALQKYEKILNPKQRENVISYIDKFFNEIKDTPINTPGWRGLAFYTLKSLLI